MTKREQASANFKAGYNCCQSLVLAFKDKIGIDETTALKLSSPFGGGMGRLREVCGAVSGMFMVVGLIYGYDSPEAKSEKVKLYGRVQTLGGDFKKMNGSIICHELLDGTGANLVGEERSETYYKKRPCGDLVGDAAEILDNYLTELEAEKMD